MCARLEQLISYRRATLKVCWVGGGGGEADYGLVTQSGG